MPGTQGLSKPEERLATAAVLAERRKIRRFGTYIVSISAIAAGLTLSWPALYVPGTLVWLDLFLSATIRLVAKEMKGNRDVRAR